MAIKLKAVFLIPYVGSSDKDLTPQSEAKIFYQEYFYDADIVQILSKGFRGRMYVKDGIGMYITGEAKINATMFTAALLNCDKFDLTDTKFILCGCCGCAMEYGVVGDIYLITSAVDYDLGHTADVRDKTNKTAITWYPNKKFSRYGHLDFDSEFVDWAYEILKNDPVKTTLNAKNYMAKSFDNAPWAIRDPKLIKATSVTADEYWKGIYAHKNAKFIVKYYGCENKYYATEMENLAVGMVFKNYGRLKDLLVIRYAVNTDVFMAGQTPEIIWGDEEESFENKTFDNFNDVIPVVSRCAFNMCWKIVDNL